MATKNPYDRVTQLRREAARELTAKNDLTLYQANQIEKALWATFIQRDERATA